MEDFNILRILGMTRWPRICLTDLSGEVPAAAVDAAMAVSPDEFQEPRPAAAMAAALRAVPQTVRPSMEGSWDDVFAEEDNYSLCREALTTSVDERIAALTRVLEAPDDDPAEMAAARAALARSRAYPQLEEWRPFEEMATRETHRSVLGGGVLPSEEACVLALYRDLLNGGEPGEAECNTSTGEDTVDKEDLRHELLVQTAYKRSLEIRTRSTKDPLEHGCTVAVINMRTKVMLWPDNNAARTVKNMTVEDVRMKQNECPASVGRPDEADDLDQLIDQLPQRVREAIQHFLGEVDRHLSVLTFPHATKAEKFVSLLEIIGGRVSLHEIIKEFANGEEGLGQMRPIIQGITATRKTLEKQKVTAYSPDDGEDAQPQTTGEESGKSAPEMEGIQRAMDSPRSLAEMASALGRVLRWREQLLSKSHSSHRAYDYKQHFKHVLNDLEFDQQRKEGDIEKERLMNCGKEHDEANGSKLVIHDMFVSGSASEATEMHIIKMDRDHIAVEAFEWVSEDGFAMPHWIEKRKGQMATRERDSSDDRSSDTFKNASDIDFMLDVGPVNWEMGAERKDSKTKQSDPDTEQCDSGTVYSHSADTDQSWSNTLRTVIEHCIEFVCCKTARDGTFIAEEAANAVQGIPYTPQPDSDTEQCGSAALRNSPNTQANSSRDQMEDGSSDSESTDNILTLHAEEIKNSPGFVKITQILRREGDASVGRTRAFTFQYIKSHVAEAIEGRSKTGQSDSDTVQDHSFDTEQSFSNVLRAISKLSNGPNVETTLNGDSIDLVPCLQYPERVNDEFVNRERPSGQPNKDLVKKLSEMPIYVVGKSGITGYKFRKSFSRLESKVIRSMTKPQRICLVLLKHCTAVTGSGLCSYDLKTAMMWVCERRAPELWTWDGMLESMMAALDFLLECVEKAAMPCYFSPEINLWEAYDKAENIFRKALTVLRLRVLLPRAIQLLLAGLLSSSQAPLMRHLLDLPLDAQQMLWCCWKRRVDDPYPMSPGNEGKIDPKDLCCDLYPAAVEGRLWSEGFLDTFRWESLPARCREPDWFAEHGWDTDSEGEEEDVDGKDGKGEEENSEGREEDRAACSKKKRTRNVLGRAPYGGECRQCSSRPIADSTALVVQFPPVFNLGDQTNLNFISLDGLLSTSVFDLSVRDPCA